MRLICPNCGAQYEITEDVIPAGGRDVQCSNCGHTWFESPSASEAASAPAYQEPEPPRAPAPVEPDYADDDLSPAPRPPAQRQPLDSSVAEILREEAEREAAARRGNAPAPIESQSDLGLAAPAGPTPQEQRNIEAARRISRLKGVEDEPSVEAKAVAAAAAAGNRKELLPDIEEINSTLRSSADRGDDIPMTPEEVVETKRRGFRFGFTSVIFLIILACLAYVLADQLKDLVPSMAGTIDAYVEMVDNARLWLDLKVQALMASIEEGGADTE